MFRIIIFGDSSAYGKWGKMGGWAGRLRSYIDEKYNINKAGNNQLFNLAIPGETTVRLLKRMRSEISMRINSTDDLIILLAIGVNDVNAANYLHGKQTSKHTFIFNFQKLIATAKTFTPRVYVLGLLGINEEKTYAAFPSFKGKFFNNDIRTYNQLLKDFCNNNGVNFIDFYNVLDVQKHYDSDGSHPNTAGHEILARKVIERLKI